jgi:hypothetical protein
MRINALGNEHVRASMHRRICRSLGLGLTGAVLRVLTAILREFERMGYRVTA